MRLFTLRGDMRLGTVQKVILYESPCLLYGPFVELSFALALPAMASLTHPHALVASQRRVLRNLESRRLAYISAKPLIEPTSFVGENSHRVARS